jgi:membrane-bound lytic murein transglycosylase A
MALPLWRNSTLRGTAIGVMTLLVAACTMVPLLAPQGPASVVAPRLAPTSWSELPGWDEDDLTEAWPALLRSCAVLGRESGWSAFCAEARTLKPTQAEIKRFLEARLQPFRVENEAGATSGLITGYYEPLLTGSRIHGAPFMTPLFGVPDDLVDVQLGDLYPELRNMRLRGRIEGHTLVPYAPRSGIEAAPGVRGKEIVWVDDAVAAFFMEVQGSGQVRLVDHGKASDVIRLSYANQNGHPYKAIGRWLVEQGEMTLENVSMQSIVAWTRSHPERLKELLFANPSYVFFKESPIVDPSLGPSGALGVALTPGRSVAVDARVVKLGVPVYLDSSWPGTGAPLRRLVIAQDTGGAIAASQARPARADLFVGMGESAGEVAGQMKQQGRMWVLLPAPGEAPG